MQLHTYPYDDNPLEIKDFIHKLSKYDKIIFTKGYLHACHQLKDNISTGNQKFLLSSLDEGEEVKEVFTNYVDLLDAVVLSITNRINIIEKTL